MPYDASSAARVDRADRLALSPKQQRRMGWESTRLLPPDEGAGDCDADALHQVAQDVDDRAAQVDVAAALLATTSSCAERLGDVPDNC